MPKGVSLAGFSQRQLNAIARQLNERPRKTLGFQTPAEMFSEMCCIDRLNPPCLAVLPCLLLRSDGPSLPEIQETCVERLQPHPLNAIEISALISISWIAAG